MIERVAQLAERPAQLAERIEQQLLAFVQHPHLARRVVLLAVMLCVPSIFTGFALDDFSGRYLWSGLEGAQRFNEVFKGGYSFGNGDAAQNHWQVEMGYAPWWIEPTLRLAFFRPLSLATHWLDAQLWLDSALLAHVHSVLWLALLVLLVTRLYRGLHAPVVAGLAALLFAIDHTHGFATGFISNRHALVSACFGVLCLLLHHRARSAIAPRVSVLPALLYLLALLAGESAVAIAGYLFAYALFMERELRQRVLSFAPYLAITLLWRVWYDHAGYGARGSGLYIDPAHDPLHFLQALLQRAPIQALGQLFLPPAELYWLYAPEPLLLHAVWLFACVSCVLFALALWPLLRRDRVVRFWALGFLLSLVPASAGYPSGRQLLLSGLGAMPLIAALWHLYAIERRTLVLGRPTQLLAAVAALVFGTHLFIAPCVLPFASCGVALSSPLARAADDLGAEIAGKDVVFITSPDYFSPRLTQLQKRIEQAALPRRWRALAFGSEPVTLQRTQSDTLVLDYRGGIMSSEALEFYRSRESRMRVGDHVELDGLRIEVLALTAGGMPERVSFSFDAPLDAPSFRFYVWRDNHYVAYRVPALGAREVLPPATLHLSAW